MNCVSKSQHFTSIDGKWAGKCRTKSYYRHVQILHFNGNTFSNWRLLKCMGFDSAVDSTQTDRTIVYRKWSASQKAAPFFINNSSDGIGLVYFNSSWIREARTNPMQCDSFVMLNNSSTRVSRSWRKEISILKSSNIIGKLVQCFTMVSSYFYIFFRNFFVFATLCRIVLHRNEDNQSNQFEGKRECGGCNNNRYGCFECHEGKIGIDYSEWTSEKGWRKARTVEKRRHKIFEKA